MENVCKKGILVFILGLSLIYGLHLDGIDVIDTLILGSIFLISAFYLVTSLFLSLKQIEAVDYWFDRLLEFDFSTKAK